MRVVHDEEKHRVEDSTRTDDAESPDRSVGVTIPATADDDTIKTALLENKPVGEPSNADASVNGTIPPTADGDIIKTALLANKPISEPSDRQ
jgi:hypothetical protein